MSLITDQFNIETRLAVGWAGLVYRAIERQTGFPVALKLLVSTEEITHPLDPAALLRDAQRLRMLSGTHVAQLLDVVDDPDGVVLVYQLCDGISGATLPSQRQVSADEIVDIASQLMTALECAERTRHPHGDVKPSNVVIAQTDDGRPFVLLLDWGLSAYRGEPTPDSLLFMAPERLAGGPPSLKADFFAAGGVLYYLLAGTSLVAGADRATLAAEWKNAKPDVLKITRPDVPVKFVQWISWLMDPRPEKRPASVAEAKQALTAFHPHPPPVTPRHLIPRPLMMKPPTQVVQKPSTPPVPRVIPVSPISSVPAAAPAPTAAEPPAAPAPQTPVPVVETEPLQPEIRHVSQPVEPAVASIQPLASPSLHRLYLIFFASLVVVFGAGVAAGMWFVKYQQAEIEAAIAKNAAGIPPVPPPKIQAAVPAAVPPVAHAKAAAKARGKPPANIPPKPPAHVPPAAPVVAATPVPAAQPVKVGPWVGRDIGRPQLKGSSVHDPKTDAWTISAGGVDIGDNSDQFYFVSSGVQSYQVIVGLVQSVEKTSEFAKAGVMFRADSEADSPIVALVVTPTRGVRFLWRLKKGGACEYQDIPDVAAPVWLKLQRKENSFAAFYSKDKIKWEPVGAPKTVPLPPLTDAGYCVTSCNGGALTKAVIVQGVLK